MKEYKVLISTNNKMIGSSMKSINENIAKECEDIETLLNSDYEMRDPETEYGELHSITEITDVITDEKEKLFIFKREINLVRFNFKGDKESLDYELSNKEMEYINMFKKITIDEELFQIEDIYYNIDEQAVEVILEHKEDIGGNK